MRGGGLLRCPAGERRMFSALFCIPVASNMIKYTVIFQFKISIRMKKHPFVVRRLSSIAISSFIAGIFIALGATVFLAIRQGGHSYSFHIVGAVFFTLGLYAIIHWNLWLFTGKVGYVGDYKPRFWVSLLICFFFNQLGAVLVPALIKLTRLYNMIEAEAKTLVAAKMNDTPLSIFILSIMCGIMIYIAVKGHQICAYPLAKTIAVFLAIPTFIMCGFEHVVANAAYFTYGHLFSAKVVWYFVLMAVGNGIGSIGLAWLYKVQHRLAQRA